MDQASGGLDADHARRMLALAESVRTRDLLRYAAPAARKRELRRLTEYLAGLSRLYAAIEEVSGAAVNRRFVEDPGIGQEGVAVPMSDLFGTQGMALLREARLGTC